jgi:AmiR/NasT family two-component response regulator
VAADRERPGSAGVAHEETTEVALQRLLAVTAGSLEQRAQLERALRSRIVVEQAKGILAERLRLTVDQAFELLRATARQNRLRIHDLARDVVEQPDTPPALLALLQERLAPSRGRTK